MVVKKQRERDASSLSGTHKLTPKSMAGPLSNTRKIPKYFLRNIPETSEK